MINKQMQERDTDMDMLKFAIQHLSKEIYDVTLCNSGYRMSTEMDETISRIEIMLRVAKLMQELNERNCSLTELAHENEDVNDECR